ncbi:hypothetical protein D3C74_384980 [compost metagenome]
MGIFAQGFFHSAPAVIPYHVEHRGQSQVHACLLHIRANARSHLAHQLRIPAGAPRDRGGVAGGAQGGETGQAFFMRQGRNAKAVGCHDLALQLGQPGPALGGFQRCRPEGASDLPQAINNFGVETSMILGEGVFHGGHVALAIAVALCRANPE